MLTQKTIQCAPPLMLLFLSLFAPVYAASCTSVSATQPIFAPMTSSSGIQTVPVTIKFNCTGLVTIGISSGTPYSSGNRQLFSAGVGIPYTIKKDTTIDLWGDGVNFDLGVVFSATGNGIEASQIATFEVSVPAGTPAGHYTNQLQVKVFDGSTSTLLTSTTLVPDLTIVDSCTISSAPTPINFGQISASSTQTLTQTANIGITCGNSVTYHWGANKGNNWDGSSRRMKAANNNSSYIAYSLNESGQPLGDAGLENYGGSNTTNIPDRSAVGTGMQKTYDITATITTNPLPAVADQYTDTVLYYVAW